MRLPAPKRLYVFDHKRYPREVSWRTLTILGNRKSHSTTSLSVNIILLCTIWPAGRVGNWSNDDRAFRVRWNVAALCLKGFTDGHSKRSRLRTQEGEGRQCSGAVSPDSAIHNVHTIRMPKGQPAISLLAVPSAKFFILSRQWYLTDSLPRWNQFFQMREICWNILPRNRRLKWQVSAI